jgi:rare lipoprotein A (peptidoglycan hydrolase)
MNPTHLQRMVWLAGITLIVGVAALALARRDAGGGQKMPPGISVQGSESGYYIARAAPYGPTPDHKRTACGEPFTKDTMGIEHPVLPCGVKIYIRYHGHVALTQVVDRGPSVPGRDFDITKALADRLDLHGTQTIQWQYAR